MDGKAVHIKTTAIAGEAGIYRGPCCRHNSRSRSFSSSCSSRDKKSNEVAVSGAAAREHTTGIIGGVAAVGSIAVSGTAWVGGTAVVCAVAVCGQLLLAMLPFTSRPQ